MKYLTDSIFNQFDHHDHRFSLTLAHFVRHKADRLLKAIPRRASSRIISHLINTINLRHGRHLFASSHYVCRPFCKRHKNDEGKGKFNAETIATAPLL
jgi:hypothetical protein